MKTSTDRILTTHTGSLPRPKALVDLVLAREEGRAVDASAFEAETVRAVEDVVARQIAAGIDWAADNTTNPVKIINLSLGGACPDPVIQTAIQHAQSKGILVVAAAGNNGHIPLGRRPIT